MDEYPNRLLDGHHCLCADRVGRVVWLGRRVVALSVPRGPWPPLNKPQPVNADAIFPICAGVKFPSWRVPMISRLGDRLLHSLVGDRGGAAVVPGLAR
jgi:hypothetical protein